MSRVLLVDDDSAGLELRKLIFERAGHRIFTATDPNKARVLFTEVQPDCVVLDLRLPAAADGRALIRELRSASPVVRIIVLAGWPLDLEGAPEAQMVNEVLAKPTRTAALLSALAASAG
jgi:CheY-like chemotaxis protein